MTKSIFIIALWFFLSGVGTYQVSEIKYELPKVKYRLVKRVMIIDEKDIRNSNADNSSYTHRVCPK